MTILEALELIALLAAISVSFVALGVVALAIGLSSDHFRA